MFLLFINDLPLHVQNSNIDIYADDATLSLSKKWKNSTSLTSMLQDDIESIYSWSNTNKMVINEGKTKSMLVTGKRLHQRLSSNETVLNVAINGNNIEQLTSHKVLGLVLDCKLSFEDHVDELWKKVSKKIGRLRHISPYLKLSQRQTYYDTIIRPAIAYCSTIWSSCNSNSINRILKCQKRASRIILDADKTARSINMFNTV
jgi:hypothetical protein